MEHEYLVDSFPAKRYYDGKTAARRLQDKLNQWSETLELVKIITTTEEIIIVWKGRAS